VCMALFQNRPQAGDTIQFYTLGQNKTIILVGLGNIGKQYEKTRHNIGFAVLDAFVTANDFPAWIEKKDLKCHLTTHTIGGVRVIAVKPTTFMNNSGEAVQAVAAFYKVPADKVTAIYDELDINFGQIRTRIGGSAAGHNGVKSVTQHIGENYGRVRIGIGPKDPPQIDSADFVLARFAKDQEAQMNNLLKEATAVLSEYIYGGNELMAETRSFIV